MNETWKKIGWSAILAAALAVVVVLNADQPKVILGATIAFVVLMLAVWLLQSGKPKPVQGNPEEVIGNTRQFLGIVSKDTDAKTMNKIQAQTQKTIVATIALVKSGKMKTTKQAAQSLVIIQPKDYSKPRQVAQVANTLAAFYLLADSQDTAVADDTKTLIDNFIAGVKDKTL